MRFHLTSQRARHIRMAVIAGLIACLSSVAAAQPEVLGGRRDVIRGDTQLIPIFLHNAANLSNINVDIRYNPQVAQINGQVARGNLVRNALFAPNANTSGLVRIGFAQSNPLGVPLGVLAYLPFRAVGQPGQHTLLKITVTAAADGKGQPLMVQTADGCLCIVHEGGVISGDPNQDGRVTALDAWIALMISVGREAELAALRIDVARAKVVCNVDGQAGVTSTDAAEILRMAAKQVAQGGKPGTRTQITGQCSCVPAPVLDPGNGGEVIERDDEDIQDAVQQHGGSQQTEDAVAAGMNWLARHQEPDGHWDCRKYGGSSHDTAVTALATLTFLGHGNSEVGGKYQDTVKRAVDWLVKQQQANGLVYSPSDTNSWSYKGYSHAIAGMALAEAAAMAKVPRTVAAARNAMAYSVNEHAYNQEGVVAWRYNPKQAGDLSVTGWYIMQLHACQLASLGVQGGVLQGAARFLDNVRVETTDGIAYGYTAASAPTPRRAAIGALSRIYTNGRDVASSIAYYANKGGTPDWNRCDLYYWYYGTLASFQHGGDQWWTWNDAMKKAITENQRKGGDEDGSWDPRGEYSSNWGRVGQTALCSLCLEVYYRYQRRGGN